MSTLSRIAIVLLLAMAAMQTPGGAATPAKPTGGLDVELVLKIQEGKDKKPLAGAHVLYMADRRWHDFGHAPGETGKDRKRSSDSFSVPRDGRGKLKGKEANYAARGRVPVQKGQRQIHFRVVKKGYHSAVFRLDCRALNKDPAAHEEITLSPHPYASVNLYMKIRKFNDTSALSGARVQYEWEGEWRDVDAAEGASDVKKSESKDAFFALDDRAGKFKGSSVNHICRARVPFGKRKQRSISFRVVKPAHESVYFSVPCRSVREPLSHYGEIILKAHGMAGDWPFNEGNGDVAKGRSGKGNPARIHGATWVRDGGRAALSFDGEDDYVDCGRSPLFETAEAITVLLWIKPPEKIDTMQGLAGRAWLNPYAFSTYTDNGLRVSVFIETFGFKTVAKTGVLKPGEWNQVGFSYKGNEGMKVFHNGKRVAEWDVLKDPKVYGTRPHRIYVPSGQKLSIGYFDGLAHFKGLIRGVKLYNYALGEEDIEATYKKGK